MSAPVWITAAALVVAPVPASPAEASEDEALALYDRGAFLEAADTAIASYISPASPAKVRARLARLAQEALFKAYGSESTPRPAFLCRALEVLEVTLPLAVDEEDVQRHQSLREAHRALLTERHPEHTCEPGTELRPILNNTGHGERGKKGDPGVKVDPPSLPADTPGPKIADSTRKHRAPFALKIAGAVATSFGVAALAAMVVGLGVRSRSIKSAIPLDMAKDQQEQGAFTVEQGRTLAALTNIRNAGGRVALAGGISGAFLLVLGAALIGRGRVLEGRTRIAPVATPGHAGVFVEGRF